MEFYHIDSDYIFEIVYLTETAPPSSIFPESDADRKKFDANRKEIEQQLGKSFSELLEHHFSLWERELLSSGDDFINYIKKDVIQLERELAPANDRKKKELWLTAKWAKNFAERTIKKNSGNYEFAFGSSKVIIDKQSIFHVILGHYIRYFAIQQPERNKSQFTEHTDLHFIKEIESFLKVAEPYITLVNPKKEIYFQKGEVIYTLVLTQIQLQVYRVTTYYKVDRASKITDLTNNYRKDRLSDDFFLFTK